MNAFKKQREIIKDSASETKQNWKAIRQGGGKKEGTKMFGLFYFSAVFFVTYVAICYVTVLFALVGVFGGLYLSFTSSPYYLFLLLLPVFSMAVLTIAGSLWRVVYPTYKKEYIKETGLDGASL